MNAGSNDLAPAAVASRLATRRLGRTYEFLESCATTNDEIARRAASGAEEGLLVVADAQSGGRGRRGRSWHSPANENLYFSLLLRPALSARLASPLTLLAGAALAQTLADLGFTPRLKWPNDVLLESNIRREPSKGSQNLCPFPPPSSPLASLGLARSGSAGQSPATPTRSLAGLRKVAGILAEMASEGDRVRHVVLGIGINVNSQEFPKSLQAIATSLRVVHGQAVDRGRLLAGFLNAFEPIYDGFLAAGPAAGLREWNQHALLGQPCWVDRPSGRLEGVAAGTDETGALLLRTATGETVSVHAGEVNWLSSP